MHGPARDIEVFRLPGQVAYAEALRLQVERRDAVERGVAGNALFLLEHAPVITLGRKSHAEHVLLDAERLAAMGIELYPTDRGGDVTYHGPGQLIAYPILNLVQWKQSIRWYLHALEEVLIRLLARFGLAGERVPPYTGVWVNGAKIAAIGIGIHDWVTFHGIALNLNPDMRHFQLIVPCGIADKPVTTLHALLPTPLTVAELMDAYENEFRQFFETDEWLRFELPKLD
jgi:lipoyl(octanoyl) transferase